jgi:hypothetical protein
MLACVSALPPNLFFRVVAGFFFFFFFFFFAVRLAVRSRRDTEEREREERKVRAARKGEVQVLYVF